MNTFITGESSASVSKKLNDSFIETNNYTSELNNKFNTFCGNALPISSYTEASGGLHQNNSWTSANNSINTMHIAIPVSAGDKITIIARPDNGAIYGFVKNYAIPMYNTTPIEWSEYSGFTGRFSVSKNTINNYTVPNDVKYIIVGTRWSGNLITPAHFIINGYDIANDIFKNIQYITTTITELEDTTTNISNSITNLQASLSAEISTRTSTDTTINNKIETEKSTRTLADTNLQQNKMQLPSANNYGTSGQYPRSTGTGIEWVDYGLPNNSVIENVITNWLNNNPDATTTVQDRSISRQKLNTILDGTISSLENVGKYALASQSPTGAGVQALIDSGEYTGLIIDTDLDLGSTPLKIPSNFTLKGMGGVIRFEDMAITTIPSGNDNGTPTHLGAEILTKILYQMGLKFHIQKEIEKFILLIIKVLLDYLENNLDSLVHKIYYLIILMMNIDLDHQQDVY